MCEISVIVPVYNVEKYLSKCIDSILRQTFTDFEIILVDDGTEDISGQICDDYVHRYHNVQVIHQRNKGLALARECGLSAAKGRYVTFVDSDDWIEKQMLEVMHKQAIDTKADVVCSCFRRFYDEKDKIEDFNVKSGTIICESKKEMIYHLHVTRQLSTSAWAKLIRRKMLENVHFPEKLAIGEEHDMVVQMIFQTTKLVLIDDVFYNYRIRKKSISRSGYNEKYKNSLNNYFAIERKMECLFPEYKTEIRGFYAEYEMAVMTAMCRNRNFDWKVIKRLRYNLRSHMKDIIKNPQTAFFMKISAILIGYTPHLFIILFSALHLFMGR